MKEISSLVVFAFVVFAISMPATAVQQSNPDSDASTIYLAAAVTFNRDCCP